MPACMENRRDLAELTETNAVLMGLRKASDAPGHKTIDAVFGMCSCLLACLFVCLFG